MAYAILLALMFSWNWGTCILRDRLFLGLGHLGVTVLGSDGNDLKSIDFKSWFQITFFICDFDLKSLFEWFWFWIDKLFANQSQTRIVASYRRRTAYIHNDKRRILTCPDFCGKFYQWALGTLFSFVYSKNVIIYTR